MSWMLWLAGDQTPPDVVEKLRAEAELALRAGVRPTLEEWRSLAPVEQNAWRSAGDAVAIATAARHGVAAHSLEAATQIAASADGGKAQKDLRDAERDQLRERLATDMQRRYLRETVS
jgi:hypothetical protein